MITKIEQIVYDFKLRKIVVYCNNNRVFIFSSRERRSNTKGWIEICDSEVETLSHREIIDMIVGKILEG